MTTKTDEEMKQKLQEVQQQLWKQVEETLYVLDEDQVERILTNAPDTFAEFRKILHEEVLIKADRMKQEIQEERAIVLENNRKAQELQTAIDALEQEKKRFEDEIERYKKNSEKQA